MGHGSRAHRLWMLPAYPLDIVKARYFDPVAGFVKAFSGQITQIFFIAVAPETVELMAWHSYEYLPGRIT